MRIRLIECITTLVVFALSPAIASAKCQLQRLGTMPVDMQDSRPLVWTKINDVKARFVLSSGAFYSTIFRDAATQYHLRVVPMPGDSFYIQGPGGIKKARQTVVGSFEFLGIPLSNVQFLVVDGSQSGNLTGYIGQNLLRMSDVEYDLANGNVNFFKSVGCDDQPLAYWATTTPYSTVKLRYMDAANPDLRATATINGHRITVWFDTGSPRSALSVDAAERLGIKTSSPDVKFLGTAGGVRSMWAAPAVTFQIGGEKIEHAHLLITSLQPERPIGDVNGVDMDMILGEDFFLSHRVYVDYSRRKLYFTYNGGPLFNLDIPPVASGALKPPAAPESASQASASIDEQGGSDTPTDADGFRRRGMAFASRREFDRALADLNRACELAPHDAEARYDRGVVYAETGQLKSALEDYRTAITLQPDDTDAHLARAELLESHPDAELAASAIDAKSDLDAVSRVAAPSAGVRMTVGVLYGRLGDYLDGLKQINQWLSFHRLSNEQASGFNNRCYLRATNNRDLHEALEDCNQALDLAPYAPKRMSHIRMALAPDDPHILDSRGLVYLRLGNLRDAIRDYDTALNVDPNMPTSLYGRGLAELRLGEKAQGQNDLAAAEKLDSGIAGRFAKMGLAP